MIQKTSPLLGLFCVILLNGMDSPHPRMRQKKLHTSSRKKPTLAPYEYLNPLIRENNNSEFIRIFKVRYLKLTLINEALRTKKIDYIVLIAEALHKFEKNLFSQYDNQTKRYRCPLALQEFMKQRLNEFTKQKIYIKTLNKWVELSILYQTLSFYSLLHAATNFDNFVVMEKLLKENIVDANSTDSEGQTPLFYVKSKQAVNLLYKHRAKIDHKNKNGQTPLHVIAQGLALEGVPVKPETISALIVREANVFAEDNNDQTPKDKAQGVYDYFKKRNTKEAEIIVKRQSTFITLLEKAEM